MSTLLADIEADGLLDTITKIHCIVTKDVETGEIKCYHEVQGGFPRQGSLSDGVVALEAADEIVFHNAIRYDVPAIKKFFPSFKPKKVRCTLTTAKLIWPNLMVLDQKANVKDFPAQLKGRHSLEAWGFRLKAHKGDFGKTSDWKVFDLAMLKYCIQDVDGPTTALRKLIKSKNYSEEAIQVEHDFASIMFEMEQHGFRFDEKAAHTLHATLVARKLELEEELKKVFKGWSEDMKTPDYWEVEIQGAFRSEDDVPIRFPTKGECQEWAKKHRQKGIKYEYVSGPLKKKHTPFNPGSRDHIAKALSEMHGWKPTVFTDGGKAQIDETTLEGLAYPEARLLLEYLMLEKRLGQLAEGDNAWLKLVKSDGRMRGEVDCMGTWTSRVTHKRPNMGQVPAVDKPFGKECRALFLPNEGHVLVGADASGIQLRALSHYLAAWDGGKYVHLVTQGDVHTANMEATGGLITTRSVAKTYIYAYLLGAGDGKIGKIIGKSPKVGKELKARFLKSFPAFKHLKNRLEERVKESGSITGLDGRVIPCENAHFGLAGLLQGFEAVVMKKATKLLYDLTSRGFVFGVDWGLCAFVHDEFQLSSRKEIADVVGKAATDAITRAGVLFGSKCPLAGEYKIGGNWCETH